MNRLQLRDIGLILLITLGLFNACGRPDLVNQKQPNISPTQISGQLGGTNTPFLADPADPSGLKPTMYALATQGVQTALAGTTAPTKPAPTTRPTVWPPPTPQWVNVTPLVGGGMIISNTSSMMGKQFLVVNSWGILPTVNTITKVRAGGAYSQSGQTGYVQGGLYVETYTTDGFTDQKQSSTYYATPTKSGKAKVIDASVTSSLTKVRIQTEDGSTWWFDVTNRQWLSGTSTPVPTTPPTTQPAPTDPADPLGEKTSVVQTDIAAERTALAAPPAPTEPASTVRPTVWPPPTPHWVNATPLVGGGTIINLRSGLPGKDFDIVNSWGYFPTLTTLWKVNAGGEFVKLGQTVYVQGGLYISVFTTDGLTDELQSSTYYATPTKSGKAKVIDASVTSSLTKVRIQTEDGSTWWFDVTNRQWLSGTSTPVPTTPPTTQPTPTGQSVQSLTLINADTDQPIAGYDPLVNGATLNFAMLPTRNLNIRANTNPATVGSVKFVLDGATYQIENSAPYALAGNNGNDYNPWTPSVGSHTLQAIPYSASGATGTQGAGITISFSVVDGGTPMPTATPKTALFVVSNANSLNAGDTAVKTRLEGLGYNVTLKTATASATSDATGKTLVLISSSVASGDVNTKFKSVTVPVITWEYALYDDMAMTNTTSGMDYGYNTGTSMVITSASHPLAGGLSGTVNLYNTSTNIPFGVPSANAINVGAVSSTSTRKLEFAYDKNAAMVGGFTVNARRVGLFLVDTATPTTDAWTLFDAAVNWSTAP